MKFTVLTLFPEIFENYLSQTILKRAIEIGLVEYNIINIRDYTKNKHNQMDDIPFGGGAGMVLKPEAYWNFFKENYSSTYNISNDISNIQCNIKDKDIKCITENTKKNENIEDKKSKLEKKPHIIFMTPQGKSLTHKKVEELSQKEEIVIISGRYEGLDQRVIDKFVDEEISIGDYVLSSGDLPALVLIDSITRIKEGVIKKESFETDSFYNGLLGYPQYTRPVEIDGYKVPEVLRSGNHKKIEEYRLQKSIEKTKQNRMDLYDKKYNEDKDFRKMVEKKEKKRKI